VRTALAGFGFFVVAGGAVVLVAARTTVAQVQARMASVATALHQAPLAGLDPAALCGFVGEGRPDVVLTPAAATVELTGPDGRVCRAPGATDLTRAEPTAAPIQWFTGSSLPRATAADGAQVLVRTEPLPGGWTAWIGGDLRDFDVLARRLQATMLLLALGGAAVAAGTGYALSRGGLKPVRDLAAAADTIARTQDLSVAVDERAGDDEVAQLGRAFNGMTAALAGARRQQAQLVADAGHELRTPLTSLRANIELLARSERSGRALGDADRAALLADVTAQLDELGRLVGDLVLLAHDPADAADRPRRPVRLDGVVNRAVERARRRADGHAVEVTTRPWLVPDADADALERAVVNLLDNALKFSPPASTVVVRSGDGRVTVDDQGPGVSADLRETAFERFWRSEDARALPGSGLGLAIVADVARAHGGSARLETAPRGGARAVLELPGHPITGGRSPGVACEASTHVVREEPAHGHGDVRQGDADLPGRDDAGGGSARPGDRRRGVPGAGGPVGIGQVDGVADAGRPGGRERGPDPHR
jgi:two-component system sensor histidine kinase MprB